MALSKRLRYEVLRRDNHACRYCGATAPEAKLTVDHVVPVALGGSDDASNLVTACVDCNAGKSSASADATVVADVADVALRYAEAMKKAAEIAKGNAAERDRFREAFDDEWSNWSYGYDKKPLPRPLDWPNTIDQLRSAGLPLEELVEAAQVACRASNVAVSSTFRYFCGVAWKKLRALQDVAQSIMEADE